jgi:hypothetical protein
MDRAIVLEHVDYLFQSMLVLWCVRAVRGGAGWARTPACSGATSKAPLSMLVLWCVRAARCGAVRGAAARQGRQHAQGRQARRHSAGAGQTG